MAGPSLLREERCPTNQPLVRGGCVNLDVALSQEWGCLRHSRSSSFSRCRSSVARPGRFPRSRSAWTTHLRRDSGAHPIFEAIERIAAHCESYWSPCSRTIRTARSRTSGEKLLARPMDPILPQDGVSGKPGTVQTSNGSPTRIRFSTTDTVGGTVTNVDWDSQKGVSKSFELQGPDCGY